MKLPEGFLENLKVNLKDDFVQYLSKFNDSPFRGLRVNTLKVSVERFKQLVDFKLKQTPFCDEGFYIDNELKGLGNHPLHHAGAFYLQEPSAMSAVAALQVEKGDRVLDLCAAPGG